VTWIVRPALLTLFLGLSLAAAGCSVLGRGGGQPDAGTTASTAGTGPEPGQVDVRRYLGPDYCPEMRILDGAELVRRYERGFDGDASHIIWQASFGETARDCLYDAQGNLLIKVGLSGRVIAGPKGGAGEVTVPLKIAVVKFKEAVLTTDGFSIAAAIPPTGSTTFTQVREITVPSPGNDRDYIIYVGFDVGKWDPLNPGAVVTPPQVARREEPVPDLPIIEEPAPQQQAQPQPQPQPQQPAQPNVLPVPSGGFVLSR